MDVTSIDQLQAKIEMQRHEINRLRRALEQILETKGPMPANQMANIAKKALLIS